jgi:hypothetical protein
MTHRFGSLVAALAICSAMLFPVSAARAEQFTRNSAPSAPSSMDPSDGDLRGATCGPLELSQLNDPDTLEAGTGVACPAPQDNFWARCYDLSTGPLAGQAITVNCVEFGVEANARTNYSVTINLYIDSTGCPPEAAGMGAPVASVNVLVPDGAANEAFTATFGAPVAVPANSRLVVELFAPGVGQTGAFFIGGNTQGQSGISYLKSAGCGIAEYVDIDTVNAGQFAGSGWKLDLGYACNGDTACCLPAGGCQVLSAAGCSTAGGEAQPCGSVCGPNTCPGTGACCHDGICEELTAAGCANVGGRFKGEDTTCSAGQCSGACCTDATCADNIALENCDAANQRYRGDGTTCAGSPPCSGGCCDGTTCSDGVSPNNCPGAYLGDGVACAPAGPASASCAPPAIPTVSEWGLIVLGMLVLGAGVIAVTRRNASAA